MLTMLETQLANRWEQELTTQLTAALLAKQRCTAEARTYRLHHASVRLRAELQALQSKQIPLLPPVTPEERCVIVCYSVAVARTPANNTGARLPSGVVHVSSNAWLQKMPLMVHYWAP